MRCAAAVLDIWSGPVVVGSHSLYALTYLVVWVDLWFFLVWYRPPITVSWLYAKCFLTTSAVRPSQDWKYHFLIDYIHVHVTGQNDTVCSYFIRYVRFDVWPKLLVCLVTSTGRSCLLAILLWSGRRQSNVWWYLHPCKILQPLLVILTFLLSKTATHSVLHSFPIEISDLYDNSSSKWYSLTFDGKCGSFSVNDVVDGICL